MPQRAAYRAAVAKEDSMAELSAKSRDRLRSDQFAYVDRDGGEHLPVHDASHTRNAIARFGQTAFESKAAKERARRKIIAAAKRFDIDVSDDAEVARSVTSLRAASTKAGPRGGRKERSPSAA
jgi:hypothetical protein